MTDGPAGGSRTRTVFLGSGGFGVPSLRAARRGTRTSTSSASSPRRRAPAGRRQTARAPTPVQAVAAGARRSPPILDAGAASRSGGDRRGARRSSPTSLVLADYGQIVPAALLELRHGALNLHPSLLPRHRGATPDPGRDPRRRCRDGRHADADGRRASTPGRSSPRRRCPLDGDETTPALETSLASSAAEPARRTVGPWLRGELAARPQPDRGRDPDPAAPARGRPARPGSSGRRARAPGPGLPAVARLVRRHAVRAPRRLVGGRRTATDRPPARSDEHRAGDRHADERLRLRRGPAGRRPADAVGRLPCAADRRSWAAPRAGPVTACASIAA